MLSTPVQCTQDTQHALPLILDNAQRPLFLCQAYNPDEAEAENGVTQQPNAGQGWLLCMLCSMIALLCVGKAGASASGTKVGRNVSDTSLSSPTRL